MCGQTKRTAVMTASFRPAAALPKQQRSTLGAGAASGAVHQVQGKHRGKHGGGRGADTQGGAAAVRGGQHTAGLQYAPGEALAAAAESKNARHVGYSGWIL